MKKSSLYTNVRANQLKMAIFLIGFLLITVPGIAEAKLITVGTDTDTVSMGNLLGIGTTNPAGSLDVSAGLASQTAGDLVVDTANTTVYVGKLDSASGNSTFIFRDRLGNQKLKFFNAGAGSFFMGNFNQNYGLKIQSGVVTSIAATATTTARLEVDSGAAAFPSAVFLTGNVGIGLTNPSAKLYVSGTSLNTLASTHSLLGGAGNVIIMADNAGSLFSATPDVFTSSISVSTLYHIKKWFTPQAGQTISSSGTTVTMANPVASYQFSSGMVGSRLTINGENRIITAYTSTSVVTVDSAYSADYSGFDYTLWGVYSRAVNIASDGSISTYSETGGVAIQKRSGDTNVYIPALLDSSNNYYLPSSILYLDKDFPIKWSGSTSYSGTVNDVGLRRTATGTLEIFDGTGTTPGTIADYRDLNIRNLNPAGGNIGIGTTTASNNKLTIVSNQSGGGIIKIQNTNIASWSSFEMFDYAGVHKSSFGYANPSAPTVAGLAHFSTSDDTPFIIAIHDLEKVRFTTDGYVGIGTTTPSGLLVLDRNQDAATDMFIVNTSASSSAKTQLLTWNGTSYSAFGARGTGFSSWGAMDANDAYMWSDDDISLLTSVAGKSIKFGTGNGTPTERMRITDAGNVGIGITNPTAKLYVYGPNATFLSATSSNTMLMGRNATEHLSVYNDDTSVVFESIQDENTAGFGNMVFRVDNDGTSDGYFAFQNKAATNFMRITATGSVAIGTTAPVSRLSVVTSTFLDNAHAISFGDNLSYYYGIGIAGGSGSEGVGIWGGSEGSAKSLTNPNLFVKRGGNVGIGTTDTTSGKLTLLGEMTINPADGIKLSSDGASSYIDGIENNLILRTRRVSGSDYIAFETSTTTRLFITGASGNIGIGTTAPTATLAVSGTVKLGTAGGAFTAMGTCTIASTAISTTPTNYTCTGVPASTAVAVNCSGGAAQSGSGTLYCRATGTANQVACNTSAANTTAMTWACMWIQP